MRLVCIAGYCKKFSFKGLKQKHRAVINKAPVSTRYETFQQSRHTIRLSSSHYCDSVQARDIKKYTMSEQPQPDMTRRKIQLKLPLSKGDKERDGMS